MNTITIVERQRNRVTCYLACIRVGDRFIRFSSMSEAGVRTWLARQGIPFTSQPEVTNQRG